MGLRLVNTAPGEDTSTVKPGQFACLGLRSETLKVPIASTQIAMGLTNLSHHQLLPEADPVLADLGATVTIETSEHRRPITGTTPVTLVSGNLIFTKSTLSTSELGIYEVKMPIDDRSSCLAVFKFKTKTAWTAFAADWCSLSNMTGMYFGLEHGTFNTALYGFLRSNGGSGSLVIGGPLQAYNVARPDQIEVLPGVPHATTPGFAWKSLPNNSAVELYIFFNVEGYEEAPVTGVPLNTPIVEVWTKIPTDPAPVVQAYIPVNALGTFPSSNAFPAFTNSRPGVSKFATMYFGNIAQTSGSDVLELDDWAFFPDFRTAVYRGIERPNHNLLFIPDAPAEYAASTNKTPLQLIPARWFADSTGLPPAPEMFFQPGRKDQAAWLALPKTDSGLSAIHRTEPRFEQRVDGIMMEAFLFGDSASPDGDGIGMGFSVEDGSKTYQVMMVGNPERKFYAIVKDLSSLNSAVNGYHEPATDADFSSLKLVRLVVDRRRPAAIGGKAQLYVDEALVLTTDLSTDTFPASSSATGLARLGQLGLPNALGTLNVAFLNYLSRYFAWEGVDNLVPDDAGLNSGILFTLDSSGTGSHAMVGTDVEIVKTTTGSVSRRIFTKDQDFAEIDGMMIDFQVQVETYADLGGAAFQPNMATGVTLTIFLGNKKVEIGFYDCGVHGRKVAILPSTGDVNDVINQTTIGQMVSAPIDWTQLTQYRLIVKGQDRVELTIGSIVNPPSITLKWQEDTDGFDLPVDVSTPRLEFGHSGNETSSKSKWSFVRWGMSNGMEIAVQQEYPNGYPKYLFGGRALFKSVFDEA